MIETQYKAAKLFLHITKRYHKTPKHSEDIRHLEHDLDLAYNAQDLDKVLEVSRALIQFGERSLEKEN